jgi:hypothetical protein
MTRRINRSPIELVLASTVVALAAAFTAALGGCAKPVSSPVPAEENTLIKPTNAPAASAEEGDSPPAESSESEHDAPALPADDVALAESSAAAGDEKPRVFSSSRAPARPGEAEKISFDDLVIGLQADVVFRPWMMGDRPKELDGKKVRISGFMHGAVEDPTRTKEFVLLRNLECKFGKGGQADHLAQVYLKPGTTTRYPGKDSIKVEGTLKIEPFTGTDGNTWSLYRIEDAEVVR